MDKNIALSDIVLSIIDNGNIENFDCTDITDILADNANKIEFMNVLITTHKQRYLRCFTDETKDSEVNFFMKDFRKLFGSEIMEDIILSNIFLFSAWQNYQSPQFKEICIKIIEHIDTCKMYEVQYSVYQKMVSIIIFCKLYGEEPFIGMLRQSKNCLNDLLSKYGVMPNYRILE